VALTGGLRGFSVEGIPRGVRAVFAARAAASGAGNLSLSGNRDRATALLARAAWSRHLNVDATEWVCGSLVHGATVRVVGEAERGRGASDSGTVLAACDGLVTATPGLPLFMPVADCAAVLLHRGGARPRLAVLHAGWRGLVAGVIEEGLRRLHEGDGEASAEIRAWISPCARAPAYEVGPELAERAPAAAVDREGARCSVDVGRWCVEILVAAGVPQTAIQDDGIDTLTDERLFSHRREGLGGGRNALIAVLEDGGAA